MDINRLKFNMLKKEIIFILSKYKQNLKTGELYPQLNAKQLENMLTKVIFISELLGRLNGSHLDGK